MADSNVSASTQRSVRNAVMKHIPEIMLCKVNEKVLGLQIFDGSDLLNIDLNDYMKNVVTLHSDHLFRLFCAISGNIAVVWSCTDLFTDKFWEFMCLSRPLLVNHKHLRGFVQNHYPYETVTLTCSLMLPYKQVKQVYSTVASLAVRSTVHIPSVILMFLAADTSCLYNVYAAQCEQELKRLEEEELIIEEQQIDVLPSYDQSILRPIKEERIKEEKIENGKVKIEKIKEEDEMLALCPPPLAEIKDEESEDYIPKKRRLSRTPSPPFEFEDLENDGITVI